MSNPVKGSDGVLRQQITLTDSDGNNVASNGKIDVAIQDQTTPDISLFLGQELDTFSLFADINIDDESFDIVTTGVAPVAGNFIFIKEGTSFNQTEILTVVAVAGNQYTITIAIPIDYAFTTSGSGFLQNVNMSVNGLATPTEFSISPVGITAGGAWDINRIIISMTMSSGGDDGLFGNIAKLAKGVYMRTTDGITQNMFNARDNSDFANQAAGDNTYVTRSGGGGTFGMRGRITYNGQDKRGVVKRLFSTTADKMLAQVRDDLTGITSYRTAVQGQVVDFS